MPGFVSFAQIERGEKVLNLAMLFETQKALDEKIYQRFPGLKEEDWSWKITALLVELGECANEWRGFKRWKEDRQPRTTVDCPQCLGRGLGYFSGGKWTGNKEKCIHCGGSGVDKSENPLLEEYVDCIHFFISIALELKMLPNQLQVYENHTESTVEATFNKLFGEVSSIDVLRGTDIPARVILGDLQETLYLAFSCFVGIGEQFFDFTWEKIEEAYFKKNKINHARQENNY